MELLEFQNNMLDPKPKALKFERTRLKPSFRKPPNKF
jgi:hypothetical protein